MFNRAIGAAEGNDGTTNDDDDDTGEGLASTELVYDKDALRKFTCDDKDGADTVSFSTRHLWIDKKTGRKGYQTALIDGVVYSIGDCVAIRTSDEEDDESGSFIVSGTSEMLTWFQMKRIPVMPKRGARILMIQSKTVMRIKSIGLHK